MPLGDLGDREFIERDLRISPVGVDPLCEPERQASADTYGLGIRNAEVEQGDLDTTALAGSPARPGAAFRRQRRRSCGGWSR